jgi:hypothetical protein
MTDAFGEHIAIESYLTHKLGSTRPEKIAVVKRDGTDEAFPAMMLPKPTMSQLEAGYMVSGEPKISWATFDPTFSWIEIAHQGHPPVIVLFNISRQLDLMAMVGATACRAMAAYDTPDNSLIFTWPPEADFDLRELLKSELGRSGLSL